MTLRKYGKEIAQFFMYIVTTSCYFLKTLPAFHPPSIDHTRQASDLKFLLQQYEHWANMLYPKLTFKDLTDRVEALASKKDFKVNSILNVDPLKSNISQKSPSSLGTVCSQRLFFIPCVHVQVVKQSALSVVSTKIARSEDSDVTASCHSILT